MQHDANSAKPSADQPEGDTAPIPAVKPPNPVRLRIKQALVWGALRVPPIRRLIDRLDASRGEVAALRAQLSVSEQYLCEARQLIAQTQRQLQSRTSLSQDFTARAARVVALSADLATAQQQPDAARVGDLRRRLDAAQARLVRSAAMRPAPVPDSIPATDLGSRERRAASPSVFFVSLPKSGTVYTWNMLARATGLRIPDFQKLDGWSDYTAGREFSCPALYACGDYHTTLLRPEAIAPYMQGFLFGAHMQASQHNIRVLKKAGIERITLLLRDPRDAFVSWVYHLRTLGPSARAYHSKLYHWPESYYDWPLAEQFAFQIRTFLPIVANWVEGWLDYCASPQRDLEVQIVYYDELKTDPRRYIQRIAEFHGIDDADLSAVRPPEAGTLHYRRGEHAQWRAEFSEPDQALAAELLQDRIPHGVDRAAAAHPALSRATASLGDNRPAAAAAAALVVLRNFPNHRPAYRLVAMAAERGGGITEAGSLLRRVERELETAELGEKFAYRFDLIDACEEIARHLARPHPLVLPEKRPERTEGWAAPDNHPRPTPLRAGASR